ncbi:hypothetical protein HanRHA438_Chr07g0301881 [Helianthus annuus]|uniref:Uncharacterized protein n=1 Tax=Helianthus annuus TaxID=4232 RepID=A0A251U9S8_HELAN|nr:hypothetical protein HanXRQr2_Chr07g0291321 [Helianthus annuus]KAF5798305.1 hypothetical protein HanXRQr2_Chr07g0291331 [Helianthus annuus]KAJ0556480.1 hypothetical protein HanIR_Chr07g0314371 [Helianthus annuus]KAJ0904424.1 hypothetical protein HanPSC8_Chr07g0282041 [Helianthus annuus]KAJ0904425.1 hypothetical protein HanPSC8_Chr07g0282051 [Helianthus annuus]
MTELASSSFRAVHLNEEEHAGDDRGHDEATVVSDNHYIRSLGFSQSLLVR